MTSILVGELFAGDAYVAFGVVRICPMTPLLRAQGFAKHAYVVFLF